MELLERLLDILQPYGTLSLVVLFLILMLCAIGLPLPEDIVLIAGGILAANGITDPTVTLIVVFVGVLGGDSMVFFLGKFFGPSIRRSIIFRRVFSPERQKKVAEGFYKYGDKLIFMARFMPGIRTLVFSTAGMYGVPYWKLFVFDGIAAVISVPFWVWVGYVFGSNFETIEQYLKTAKLGIFGVFLITGFVILGIYLYKKRRRSNP